MQLIVSIAIFLDMIPQSLILGMMYFQKYDLEIGRMHINHYLNMLVGLIVPTIKQEQHAKISKIKRLVCHIR